MAIDPKLIEELEARRRRIMLSGGEEKIEKRHAAGDCTARERLDSLFDDGSFTEFGMHTRHHCHNFGLDKKDIPADGIVVGVGLVNGKPVAASSADFMAQGGSLGYMHALKIEDAQHYALKAGIPMIQINDSGGAPEGAAVWADAATFIPDTLYDVFADEGLLREQYPMMRDWVDWVTRCDTQRHGRQTYLYNCIRRLACHGRGHGPEHEGRHRGRVCGVRLLLRLHGEDSEGGAYFGLFGGRG